MREETTPPVGAAEGGVPETAWQRVHPLTALIDSWQAVAAIIAFALWQNPEVLDVLRRPELISAVGSSRAITIGVSVILTGLVLMVVVAYLRWRCTAYAVGEDAVWFRHGMIFRSQRHARFDRIQAVDVVHPLLGRLLGMGKLHIEVAGGSDSHFDIAYLGSDTLESLRAQVSALASGARQSQRQVRVNAEATRASFPHTPGLAPTPTPPAYTTSTDGPPMGTAPMDGGDPTAPAVLPPEGGADASSMIPTPAPDAQAPIGGMLAEERPVYSVPVERHVMSLVRSISLLLMMGVELVLVVVALSMLAFYPAVAAAMAVPLLTIGAGIVQQIWKETAGNFNFSAAVSDEGIRIKRGLTETRYQTIPPRRVHAVEISQPVLWRSPDWYRVRILQAGYGRNTEESTPSDVLLPVGTRAEAELALWLVAPDLGVDDPLALIEAGLTGDNSHPDPYFVGVPQRVWPVDPLVWRRRAFALTNAAVIIRGGWFTRTLTVVPVERVQSIAIEQDPWEKHRTVATVNLEMVPGQVRTRVIHADQSDASDLARELVRLSAQRRRSEDHATWRARTCGDMAPYEEPTPAAPQGKE